MRRQQFLRWIGAILAVGCLIGHDTEAVAQRGVKAITGRPFGVAEFTLPLPDAADGGFADADAFELIEKNGRAFYPVLTAGQFGEFVSELLGDDLPKLPSRLRVSFLFTGDGPLELTVLTPERHEFVVTPEAPRRSRDLDRSLQKWWRTYSTRASDQQNEGDYPPLVQAYLTSMLAQRLGLQPPPRIRRQEPDQSELQQTIGLLFGAEYLRSAVLRETMRGGGGLGETASIPVPPEVTWQPRAFPGDVPPVDVEPIAMHVPEECFYVRFGSFTNYLWLDHLKHDYGGDVGRMVTLRGHNARLDEKIQRQLAIKQSALAEILGPQVISDVALIGRDLYLREGAAFGVLFEASNTAALGANFTTDRNAALNGADADGATLESVSIAGRDVSFLSTPDNRLRSFYAVDGNYHLVTSSRAVVERFYAAGAGQGSLGKSAEFQHARAALPLSREDTIFAYFSSAFFRSLLSPQYQIELARRLRSVTDMELVQLAELAARAEGSDHATIDDLIAGGYLPAGFGHRGDGRPPLMTGDGFVDPLRGARGTFTPIPDVPLETITPTEAALYNRCARYIQTHWRQMDPLMVGIKRYALDQERHERIVIDANVSPLAEEKYGWVLSMVGPPTDVRIQSDPTDVLTMQMSLKGGLLWPSIPAHHLFIGVQDTEPAVDVIPSGFLKTLRMLRTTPGYLGAWPQLGLLDLLPFLATEPDALGFSRLPFGLWRWQGGGFSVLSFQQGVLAEAAADLESVPTEDPAQIRLRVGDLAHSKLAWWMTVLNYSRAYQASVGNVQLLNTLSQQFRVPRPDALDLANRLLDTQLVCTLGGEYEIAEGPHGVGMWRSTGWPPVPDKLPETYAAPLLEWFRGASVDLTKQTGGMFLHAEIDMQRKEREPAVKLPLFNLFGGKQDSDEEEK